MFWKIILLFVLANCLSVFLPHVSISFMLAVILSTRTSSLRLPFMCVLLKKVLCCFSLCCFWPQGCQRAWHKHGYTLKLNCQRYFKREGNSARFLTHVFFIYIRDVASVGFEHSGVTILSAKVGEAAETEWMTKQLTALSLSHMDMRPTHTQMREYKVNGGVEAYGRSGYALYMLSRLLSPTDFLYPSWILPESLTLLFRQLKGNTGNQPGDILSEKERERERERRTTPDITFSRRLQCTQPPSNSAFVQRRGLCKSELDGGRAGEGGMQTESKRERERERDA